MVVIFILLVVVLVVINYHKIPLRSKHMMRNTYNVMPVGKLTIISDNTYRDDNHIIWKKRSYIGSIYHDPIKNYVFETYDPNRVSSSEAVANKKMFDNGVQIFSPGTYNYYSSYFYPISHIFADILPIHWW